MTGRLIGIGVGPGDPELMTLKAARKIAAAPVVAFFAKAGHTSHARHIAAGHFNAAVVELPLLYPVTTEQHRHSAQYRLAMADFYTDAAGQIAGHLTNGHDVAVLSEGDPLFYGSYMHLHIRLLDRFQTEIVPGVMGMAGCWSTTATPIAQGDDVLTILPGTLDEDRLAAGLRQSEAAVIMKVGRNLPKIRRALEQAGRLSDALYVERGTMADGFHVPLSEREDGPAPYFSIVLVPGWRS